MSYEANNRASTASTDATSSTNGTISTTKKTERSSFMNLVQSAMKPIMSNMPGPKKDYPPGSPQLEAHKVAKKHCNVHERVVEDVYIYDLQPKSDDTNASQANGKGKYVRQIYYFAGGSWRMPPSKEHWAFCAELAKQLPDTRVSIVSCPLAPNSPAPDTLPHLMRMYRRLLQDADATGEIVILAGDSSGGETVLCLTANAIAQNPSAPAPAALIAVCPSIDLRQDNPDQPDIETKDPILRVHSSRDHADKWRGPWEATDPRINPLFADWGLVAHKGVQVHGVVGGHDILQPDALKLRDQLLEVGVRGEWLDWDKQMHGFPLTWTYGLEEGKEAKNWIVDLISRV